MTESLGVVVPAYRPDVETLAEYVAALRDRFPAATVRVELDAATPATRARLASLPVAVDAVDARRGKGAAITAGFEALDADVLAFVDADGSTAVDSVAAVVEPVREGRADLAVGSRRHPEACVADHQTVARRWLGAGFARLARRLLDVDLADFQCGAKAITRDAWAAVREHLYDPGFAWDVELVAVAAALGRTIAEVPVDWRDRPGSTVDPIRSTVRMGWTLLSARQRADRIGQSTAACRCLEAIDRREVVRS